MVTLNLLEKYELVGDVRMHNKKTPATEPVSTTLSVISVDDEKTELTLVTALVGDAEHVPDVITSADESSDTFTNPPPLITID